MRHLPGMPSDAVSAGVGEPAAWFVGACSDPSLITITHRESEEADITLYCVISEATVNETSVTYVPAAARRSVWMRRGREELVQRRCQEFAAQSTIILLRHAYGTTVCGAESRVSHGSALRLVQ